MFDFIRTHQRLMQFVLLLLIFPSFVFFGIEGYSRFSDGGNAVAKVAGHSITQQEFDAAQREQIDRYRQMLGAQFDPKMLDTPEAKQGILESLIQQRVLAAEAAKNNLSVSDQALQRNIMSTPGLTGPDGKFDGERYKSLLAGQGMTPLGYEALLRRELTLAQVTGAIQGSAFAPKTVATRLSDLNDQEREVQEALFKAADFTSQVKVTDEMLKAYYEKNGSQFEVPEQVKAEYLVLNSEAVASQITVSDADIKSYYEQNAKRYTDEEQRRASHILIKADKNASAAERAAAKEKAEKLLAQVRANPADFARVAKENSADTASGEQGGDLGFFAKGATASPALEDAAFKLKEGEISDVVQSEYGYHIVKLTGIKPGSVKSLDEVKNQIAADIKKQLASKKFTEMAEQFTNMVYEQSESLKPVADKLHLKIETVAGLTRTPNPALGTNAPYNNAKFLNALFSNESIKNKRNTEAVEVAPSVLVAGHVIEYKPVTRKPFEEVQAVVRERVVQAEAAALAKKAGEDKLAAAKSGNASGFSDAKLISRVKQQNMRPDALMAIMKADVAKLPAYVGVDLPGLGYGVYRINKVQQPATVDAARRQAEQQQIANAIAQEESFAYMEALKKKSKVEILRAPGGAKPEGN